jgi:hypothetical protein
MAQFDRTGRLAKMRPKVRPKVIAYAPSGVLR